MNFIVKSLRRFPYLFLSIFFAIGVVFEYNVQLGDSNLIGLGISLGVAILSFVWYCYTVSNRLLVKSEDEACPFSTIPISLLFFLFSFFFLGAICENSMHPISAEELESRGVVGKRSVVAKIKSVPKRTRSRRISCEADVYFTDEENSKSPVFTMLTFDTCEVPFKKGNYVAFPTLLKSTESDEAIGFNYDIYLRKKGVEATAMVKQYQLLDSANVWSLETSASEINETLKKSVVNDSPDDARNLIVAITLGNKTDMDDGLKDAYSKAGASHLLAVSGLHVGIIILIVETLVGFAIHPKKRPLLFAMILLSLIWEYAFLTGLAASVVRTSLMYTVYRIALLLFSKPNPINVVSFTAFCMLVYNPFNIFDLGFQLSFSAVYSILLFGQPLIRKFEEWTPNVETGHAPSLPIIRKSISKIRTYVIGSVAISIAAQILTTPITLFIFHTMPILSITSSLVTIPLVTVLIPISFVYYGIFALSTVLPVLTTFADFVLYLASILADVVNAIVYYTADFSFCTINRLPFYCYDVATWIVVALLIAAYYNYRRISLLWIPAIISVAYFVIAVVDGMDVKSRQMLAVYNVNGVTAVNRLTESNELFGCNDTLKVANKACDFWTNSLVPIPSSTEKKYLTFDTSRVYILSDKEDVKRKVLIPLNVDILILANNVTTKMDDLKNFRFKKLIVDGSNKSYVAKKWDEERKKSGVECHIVRFDGSYLLKDSEFYIVNNQ